jgi:hypothetical protein
MDDATLQKLPFQAATLVAQFGPYENIIQPVIRTMAEKHSLTKIIIMGYLGPGELDPTWQFHIEAGKNTFTFPAIIPSGRYVKNDPSDEQDIKSLKKCLRQYSPFLADASSRLFHWRNCETLRIEGALKKLTNLFDYEDGLKMGLYPCSFCIAKD